MFSVGKLNSLHSQTVALPGLSPREVETYLYKSSHVNGDGIILHYSPNWKQSKLPIKWWLGEQNIVYSHTGMIKFKNEVLIYTACEQIQQIY